MRIGLIENKVDRRKGNLGLIAKAFSDSQLDAVVAPEFFLSGFDISGSSVLTFKSAIDIMKKLEDLSREFNGLIIPGTMLYIDPRNRVVNACPVSYRGDTTLFFKESDCGESVIAEQRGKEYFKGDSSRNTFTIDGKVFALEICKDQGRQNIPKDTDIEIVPSYDLRSGFHISSDKGIKSRDILLCDGQRPMVSGARFDKTTRNVSIYDPVKLNGVAIYDIQ